MIRSRVDVTKFVVPETVDRNEKVPREEGAHPKQIEDEVDSVEAVPWWRFAGVFRKQEICKMYKQAIKTHFTTGLRIQITSYDSLSLLSIHKLSLSYNTYVNPSDLYLIQLNLFGDEIKHPDIPEPHRVPHV